MFTEPMVDPMGGLLADIRGDSHVDNLVDGRVRGFEPKGVTRNSAGNITYEGDALGPGAYKAFVVVSALDVPPHPTVPITFATYGVRCYGVTAQGAWTVWAAIVKALHNVGNRTSGSLRIYKTFVISGGEQDKDPRTQQPVVTGTIELIASTYVAA